MVPEDGSLAAFAGLLDALEWRKATVDRIDLLAGYFARTPDPDRAVALALLDGRLTWPRLSAATLRQAIGDCLDPALWKLAASHVGDALETLALIWPEARPGAAVSSVDAPPGLAAFAEAHAAARGTTDPCAALPPALDRLDARGRRVLLDLVAGRRGALPDSRELRAALARLGGAAAGALDEVWPELAPPYAGLRAWLDGKGPQPAPAAPTGYRKPMPARPLASLRDLPADFARSHAVEWRRSGHRVLLVGDGRQLGLFDRDGLRLDARVPELLDARPWRGVADGVLQAEDGSGTPRPEALARRLGRQRAGRTDPRERPLRLWLHDLLVDDDEDLRTRAWTDRRERLAALWPALMGLPVAPSEPLDLPDHAALEAVLAALPEGCEGLIVKRRDGPYTADPERSDWRVLRPPPQHLRCVLLYARRDDPSHPGLFAGCTLGLADGEGLVPLAFADWSLARAEAEALDRWVRAHTVKRYGPVREVAPTLRIDIEYDRQEASGRHKSGWRLFGVRALQIHLDSAAEAGPADALAVLAARVRGASGRAG